MALVRTADLLLELSGRDVSGIVAGAIISATYTDNEHGTADDLEVTLEDRKGLWHGRWEPSRGMRMVASIVCRDWQSAGRDLSLSCGSFELDELELRGGMRGDTVSLKGVAAPVSKALRWETRSRAWEAATLHRVARDIASEHGLSPVLRGEDMPFSRLDQTEETDLAFLQRLSEQAGRSLKVSDGRLILFSAGDYDAGPTVAVLRRGDTAISTWSVKAKHHGLAKKARVRFHAPATKELTEAEVAPDDAPEVGATLQVNERVESTAQARSLGAHKLRKKNQKEFEATFELMGDPRLRAGACVAIEGFGGMDRTYVISKAVHELTRTSGYRTTINLRTALGY